MRFNKLSEVRNYFALNKLISKCLTGINKSIMKTIDSSRDTSRCVLGYRKIQRKKQKNSNLITVDRYGS